MKALAINGSPRKGGNTETLLNAVLKPLAEAGWETELIQIGGRELPGCKACFKCMERRDRRCIFGKDIFNDVFAKMVEADAIILGSPTYFADVTPEIKALMDRSGFVHMANGGLLAGKVGAGVVAVRRGGATHVLDTMTHLFQICQMVIPGSTYWNMGYGLQPGEVGGDVEGMANMAHLGRAIDWLGRAIQSGGVPYPRRTEGCEG
nr:flavodoxin family protein [uncultured Holophaga sp.]